MKFCDEKIQKHLLNDGKIKRKVEDGAIILKILKGNIVFDNDENICYIDEEDLTDTNWEIVEPEYDWNKIIKDKILCMFWNNNAKLYRLGYMVDITETGKYIALVFGGDSSSSICTDYDYSKPFNPAEFNIAKDLKEYEK